MPSLGRERRLRRLFHPASRKTIIVPVDDSLITGPTQGLEDLETKISRIIEGKPNAVLCFSGTAARFAHVMADTPRIINLTASTVHSHHTRKVLVTSVEEAFSLDADAVAVHVNVTSRFESLMLKNLGRVAGLCSRFGMPLLAIMYPRREGPSGDDNYDVLKLKNLGEYVGLVAHAARIGFELGADVVKVPYTGDPESFRRVVAACQPVPLVVAGGPRKPVLEVLRMAAEVIEAGGAGVSFGRNIFGRQNPTPWIQALKRIVLEGCPQESVAYLVQNEECL